jgi:hypothetical protein
MATQVFSDTVTSAEALREIIGYPTERAVRKQISSLDHHCRDFIARSPFLLLGTSSAAGTCDVSPKGDAPGFVLVLDDNTIAIPDRPGNRRADTLCNILENPRVGLLFIVPGMEETLRVNGRASIVRDEQLLERTSFNGKRPLLAIVVEVQEAFMHCAKAFKRSHLWETESWPARSELPSMAQILMDHARVTECTLDEVERQIAESYKTRLY